MRIWVSSLLILLLSGCYGHSCDWDVGIVAGYEACMLDTTCYLTAEDYRAYNAAKARNNRWDCDEE